MVLVQEFKKVQKPWPHTASLLLSRRWRGQRRGRELTGAASPCVGRAVTVAEVQSTHNGDAASGSATIGADELPAIGTFISTMFSH